MSKRSQPEDISTNEPSPKKQAITPEMYKKLEVKIAELEKRNVEAQEMTQKQIEKFQDRTAKAEEKLSQIKECYSYIIKLEDRKKKSMEDIQILNEDYRKIACSSDRLNKKFSTEISKINVMMNKYTNKIKQLVCPDILPPPAFGSPAFGPSAAGPHAATTTFAPAS